MKKAVHRCILSACTATMLVSVFGCRTASHAQPPRRSWAEVNAPAEGAEPRSMAREIALYIPNRVLDLGDVVSVGVGLFPNGFLTRLLAIHGNVRVTRALQLGAGNARDGFWGWNYKRRLLAVQKNAEFSVGPLTLCNLADLGLSTGRDDDVRTTKMGLIVPADDVFAQGRMDYWSVGAQVSLILVSAKAELHPLELIDAMAGLFLIDLMDDDL